MSGNKTVVALAIAILVGILAVIAAALFLGQQKPAPAVVGAGPVVSTPVQKPPMRQVVVLVKPVSAHQTIEAEDLKQVELPLYDLPPGHVVDLKELIGRRAMVDLVPNMPLLQGQLIPREQDTEMAALLKEGSRAVTIQVSEAGDVAGFVLPGNYVDVLLNGADRGGEGAYSRVLLQDIKVIAIAQDRFVADRLVAQPVGSVTLEVTPAQAEMLDMARAVGSISLALRNQNDRGVVKTLGARQEELHASKPVVEIIRGATRSYE